MNATSESTYVVVSYAQRGRQTALLATRPSTNNSRFTQ